MAPALHSFTQETHLQWILKALYHGMEEKSNWIN